MTRRIETERQLWDMIPCVLDHQCAWQLLVQSANPRANHSLRTLPGLWGVAEIFRTFKAWQTETQRRSPVCRSWEDWDCAPHKDAPKLLRASWADALPMISDRNPDVASLVEDVMALEAPAGGCLAELRVATVRLDREGLTERPTWPELRHGKRPPVNTSCEPGEWQHGWQFWASSVSDAFFREDLHAVMPNCCSPSSHWHTCVVAPLLFRVLLLERLHLPLPVTEAVCSCGATLDRKGNTKLRVPQRLKRRATPVKRVVARIFREAGARVRFNALVQDMNVGVPSAAERRIEVLAQDLPCFGGGSACCGRHPSVPFAQHRRATPKRRKRQRASAATSSEGKTTCPELVRSGRCRLVVLAMETGGRWSEETVSVIHQLAITRAREVPSYLSHQVALHGRDVGLACSPPHAQSHSSPRWWTLLAL